LDEKSLTAYIVYDIADQKCTHVVIGDKSSELSIVHHLITWGWKRQIKDLPKDLFTCKTVEGLNTIANNFSRHVETYIYSCPFTVDDNKVEEVISKHPLFPQPRQYGKPTYRRISNQYR
jgi:nitrogen fixation protein